MSIYSMALTMTVMVSFAHADKDPQALHAEHLNMLPGMKPSQVNGYQTDRPAESQLADNPRGLEQKASSAAASNPHAEVLLESAHQRPYFAIDPIEDPLVTTAEEAVANPEKVIQEAGSLQYEEPEYEEKTCEESKPTSQVECTKTLKVATFTRKQRIYINSRKADTPNNNFGQYLHAPNATEYSRYYSDGCNWQLEELRHIYRYEVQEVYFDAESGTTRAGEWREVEKDVYEQTPDDKLKDEWIDSCAYLKANETLGGQK